MKDPSGKISILKGFEGEKSNSLIFHDFSRFSRCATTMTVDDSSGKLDVKQYYLNKRFKVAQKYNGRDRKPHN